MTSTHATRPGRSDGADGTDAAAGAPEFPEAPPEDEGLAEVRIIAADPDIARRVALVLREVFACDEPRSYPTGPDGRGTLLHLTVDTRTADGLPSAPSDWLDTSRSHARRSHTDEPG
ncbi:hypothetical protein [Streptomyces antibioticus]|uniref:hypothetical protein n=1 Tax=Streptomyces antibioticus TaxID=1890 RepID=UPI00340EA859